MFAWSFTQALLEMSEHSHLEQGYRAVRPGGAEPYPWPTFPDKVRCSSLLPHLPSQHTVPWRASCLQTTPALSDKQARSKTSPKVCLLLLLLLLAVMSECVTP